MAEKHKSKYKKPEYSKPTSRKDLKTYTMNDTSNGLNPFTTGDKHLGVLRKTDKVFQDDGNLYPTYAADDRLYRDLEDGEYDPKTAAKRLKKRQDDEEKNVKDVLKDKIENLTREGKEQLVREYIRRKIVKILNEQPTPKEEPEAPAPEAPEAPAPEAPEAPAPEAPAPAPEAPAPEAPAPEAPAPEAPAPEAPAPEAPDAQLADPEQKEASGIFALRKWLEYLKLKQEKGPLSLTKHAIAPFAATIKQLSPEDAELAKELAIKQIKNISIEDKEKK